MSVGVVPGRRRSVRQQHCGVRRDGRRHHGRGQSGRPCGGAEHPAGPTVPQRAGQKWAQLGNACQRGERAVRRQQPGADRHRRGHLDDPQHVQETGRPAEVVHQRHHGEAQPDQSAEPTGAAQGRAVGDIGSGREQGGAGRHPAEEQVGRDVELPWRGLDDGPAVIGGELGRRHHGPLALHDRPPANAATAPASRVTAASPALRHIAGRSLVVTTGSGGRP